MSVSSHMSVTIMSKFGRNIHIQDFCMSVILYYLWTNKYIIEIKKLVEILYDCIKGKFQIPSESINYKTDT